MLRAQISRATPVVLALALLWAGGSAAGDPKREAMELREAATGMYKHQDYAGAAEALERAQALVPEDAELQRMLGACRAMQGDVQGAYAAYRAYTQQCPGCMYAPQVRMIVRQYEEANDLPLTPLPPEDQAGLDNLRAWGDARRQAEREAEEASARSSRDEIMAKRLLSNARTIRQRNPLGALANCLEVLRRLPRGHGRHPEARELYQEIAWMPAPPLEAAPRPGTTEEGRREAKKLYEEAYVVKSTDPELAKRKLLEALELTPEDDVYHEKSLRLLDRIRRGED
jgi:hypothetical protein